MLKIFGENRYEFGAFVTTLGLAIGVAMMYNLGESSGKLKAYKDCREMLEDAMEEAKDTLKNQKS